MELHLFVNPGREKLFLARQISARQRSAVMSFIPDHTTLHNSHETENITKAVDHKPTDSKTCTKFRDDHYLMIWNILIYL